MFLCVFSAFLIPIDAWTEGDRFHFVDPHASSTLPFYPRLGLFGALTTPQWVDEEGVKAVIIPSIDDVDFNIPESLNATRDLLQVFLNYTNVTVTLMQTGPTPDFEEAHTEFPNSTYGLHTISHICSLEFNEPRLFVQEIAHQVAFLGHMSNGSNFVISRLPCFDSRDTTVGRHFKNILLHHFMALDGGFNSFKADSSIVNFNSIPFESLQVEAFRDHVFAKFVDPKPELTVRLFDYPYPFPIGGRVWEFPVTVPTDWHMYCMKFDDGTCTKQYELLHGRVELPPLPEINLVDLLRSIGGIVEREGVSVLALHPTSWGLTPEGLNSVLLSLEKSFLKGLYKFMSFEDAVAKIEEKVCLGAPLGNSHCIPVDINGDNLIDALVLPDKTNVWDPEAKVWVSCPLPFHLHPDADFSLLRLSEDNATALLYNDTLSRWVPPCTWISASVQPLPAEVFVSRDVNSDGYTDLVLTNGQIVLFDPYRAGFYLFPLRLPSFIPPLPSRRGGRLTQEDRWFRFEDFNEDGWLDLIGCIGFEGEDPPQPPFSEFVWFEHDIMIAVYERCFLYLFKPNQGREGMWGAPEPFQFAPVAEWECVFDGRAPAPPFDFFLDPPKVHWVDASGIPRVRPNFLEEVRNMTKARCVGEEEGAGGWEER